METEDHYGTASKMLKEAKFTWTSYENKQTRPIRVIVRRVNKSYTPDHIVQDLARGDIKLSLQ